MQTIIAIILFCGIVIAVAAQIIERNRSISDFLMNFGIGVFAATWTLFAMTYIVPQII